MSWNQNSGSPRLTTQGLSVRLHKQLPYYRIERWSSNSSTQDCDAIDERQNANHYAEGPQRTHHIEVEVNSKSVDEVGFMISLTVKHLVERKSSVRVSTFFISNSRVRESYQYRYDVTFAATYIESSSLNSWRRSSRRVTLLRQAGCWCL